jgi:hypothetical protein
MLRNEIGNAEVYAGCVPIPLFPNIMFTPCTSFNLKYLIYVLATHEANVTGAYNPVG